MFAHTHMVLLGRRRCWTLLPEQVGPKVIGWLTPMPKRVILPWRFSMPFWLHSSPRRSHYNGTKTQVKAMKSPMADVSLSCLFTRGCSLVKSHVGLALFLGMAQTPCLLRSGAWHMARRSSCGAGAQFSWHVGWRARKGPYMSPQKIEEYITSPN